MGLLDKTRQFLALDKSLRTLLVTSVIMNLGSSLWGPLLGLYITNNLGVSLLMFGLMTTVRQLAQSLTIFPSGFLSDNFGRKKILIASYFFSILALITLFVVRDLPWLFLVSIFQGLNMALIGPSKSAYVAEVVSEERRGIAYSTLALFQSLSNGHRNIDSGRHRNRIWFFLGFLLRFNVGIHRAHRNYRVPQRVLESRDGYKKPLKGIRVQTI